MIAAGLDVARGHLLLPGGGRVGRGATASPGAVRAALHAAGVAWTDADPGAPAAVTCAATIGGRGLEITLRFRVEELAFLRLVEPAGAEEHDVARTLRDRAWLASFLGPAGYENARGAMYAFDWGWIHAACGEVFLTYPGHRPAVPLPRPGAPGSAPHRCCGCGHVMDLGYDSGVLEVHRSRGGAPCEACGAIAWVQAGSMTEFYRYSQRPDVCEVGKHPAEGIQTYTLVARDAPPAAPGVLRIDRLVLKACPAHVGELRRGFLGCYLLD